MAFVCYIIVLDRGITQHKMPDADITLFCLIFQCFMGIVVIVVANFCYMLGPWSETYLKPVNLNRYRSVTFNLGFWFSIFLPFSIPVMLDLFYKIR